MASESTPNPDGWVVKFVPLSSSVSSPFWVNYCREKLERIQLSEAPIGVTANAGVGTSRLECHEGSLGESVVTNELIAIKGKLVGYNTLEDLQKVDKNALLRDAFLPQFRQGDMDALTSMVLLAFADLKNHKVLYWFAIPALVPGQSIRATQQQLLRTAWKDAKCTALARRVDAMRQKYNSLAPFFLVTDSLSEPLSRDAYRKLTDAGVSSDDILFGFVDTCPMTDSLQEQQAMGWTMRNLVAYLALYLDLGGQTVHLLSYRPQRLRRLATETEDVVDVAVDTECLNSILLDVVVPTKEDYKWSNDDKDMRVVGWELNARGKPGPRWVNLRPLLDSQHLAVQAADLNLKLMKWRMIPNLQVDKLQSTKALLIGAGTLGCNVARVSLAWGIRNFKIVDYGKVSYSNPVRQSLFTLEDCHAEGGAGKSKAEAAAEALRHIAADVKSEGIALSIPMPGHVENLEAIQRSVETLDRLVQEADVVFLLTDTRESRWLPTVMAAAHNKMLINAALGLDSWLVMRHGGGDSPPDRRLGCYFCNDVVAPENSTRNRTLDQQCTVTRPGLAPIASSMAVELMASLLHHPDYLHAAAPTHRSTDFTTGGDKCTSSPLGVIPHQIRGSVVSYTMMTPTVPAFPQCTGCSNIVVDSYRTDKMGLVEKACDAQGAVHLEKLSGLHDFRARALETMANMDEWDDDAEDESSLPE